MGRKTRHPGGRTSRTSSRRWTRTSSPWRPASDRGAEDPERHPPRRSDRRRGDGGSHPRGEAKRDFSFEAASHVEDLGPSSGCSISRPGVRCAAPGFVHRRGRDARARAHQLGDGEGGVKGFTPMVVPDLVRQSTMEKWVPAEGKAQVYNVEDSDLLSPGRRFCSAACTWTRPSPRRSSRSRWRRFCFSACETEAGAGAAAAGYAAPQFSKVEMFAIATPEQSRRSATSPDRGGDVQELGSAPGFWT